ncbi:hypothetical protein AAG570_007181 [Ranatra chinensis]|uniref:DUF4780 domain-containing protein n=1 Tax=Ranatra chinensis TaxID=642074 RepID=A0ABD0XXU1_9HEMI
MRGKRKPTSFNNRTVHRFDFHAGRGRSRSTGEIRREGWISCHILRLQECQRSDVDPEARMTPRHDPYGEIHRRASRLDEYDERRRYSAYGEEPPEKRYRGREAPIGSLSSRSRDRRSPESRRYDSLSGRLDYERGDDRGRRVVRDDTYRVGGCSHARGSCEQFGCHGNTRGLESGSRHRQHSERADRNKSPEYLRGYRDMGSPGETGQWDYPTERRHRGVDPGHRGVDPGHRGYDEHLKWDGQLGKASRPSPATDYRNKLESASRYRNRTRSPPNEWSHTVTNPNVATGKTKSRPPNNVASNIDTDLRYLNPDPMFNEYGGGHQPQFGANPTGLVEDAPYGRQDYGYYGRQGGFSAQNGNLGNQGAFAGQGGQEGYDVEVVGRAGGSIVRDGARHADHGYHDNLNRRGHVCPQGGCDCGGNQGGGGHQGIFGRLGGFDDQGGYTAGRGGGEMGYGNRGGNYVDPGGYDYQGGFGRDGNFNNGDQGIFGRLGGFDHQRGCDGGGHFDDQGSGGRYANDEGIFGRLGGFGHERGGGVVEEGGFGDGQAPGSGNFGPQPGHDDRANIGSQGSFTCEGILGSNEGGLGDPRSAAEEQVQPTLSQPPELNLDPHKLKVFVLRENHPDFKFRYADYCSFKTALGERIAAIQRGSFFPRFQKSRMTKGVIEVCAADFESKQWLFGVIGQINPFNFGLELSEEPCLTRHKVFFYVREYPPPPMEDIFYCLEKQNPGIDTKLWSVSWSKEVPGVGIRFTVTIDQMSLETLEKLDWKLFMRASQLRVSPVKPKNPVVENPPEVAPPPRRTGRRRRNSGRRGAPNRPPMEDFYGNNPDIPWEVLSEVGPTDGEQQPPVGNSQLADGQVLPATG